MAASCNGCHVPALLLLLVIASLARGLEAQGRCGAGEACVHNSECPAWLQGAQQLDRLTSGTPTHKRLIALLRSKICNKRENHVCCKGESVSECLPSSPSCLPSLGHCGNTTSSANFVLNGKDSQPGQYPATALLGNKTTWVCGGTLINQWYVVTAAHCQGRGREALATVRLGEYQVTRSNRRDCLADRTTCLPPVQDFTIRPQDITLHPEFQLVRTGGRLRQVHNDIALIRLPRRARLNVAVSVACLPIDSLATARSLAVPDLRSGLEGTRPVVVGWGYSGRRDFEDTRVATSVQQHLPVPVLSPTECSILEPISSQICAGGERGKDSCKGDSGGPLYAKEFLRGRNLNFEDRPWFLIGLVSFGTNPCGRGKPGIYTRLESFVPWIQDVIKG